MTIENPNAAPTNAPTHAGSEHVHQFALAYSRAHTATPRDPSAVIAALHQLHTATTDAIASLQSAQTEAADAAAKLAAF